MHFSEPIHHIEYLDKEWDAASQLARDGSDWLLMSLDRQRFKDRIERTAEVLDRILDKEFRNHIYLERFKDFVTNQESKSRADFTGHGSRDKYIKISAKNSEIDDSDSNLDCTQNSNNSNVTGNQTVGVQNTNSPYISRKRSRQKKRKRGHYRKNRGHKSRY